MKLFSNILFAKIYPESDKVPFRVRGTGYVRNDPATRQKMRVCNFVELFWCVGGGCTFHYPEGTYTLHPGEVCFYNSGCLHDYIPLDSGFEYHWLSIEGAQAEKFFQGFHTSRLPRHVGTCPDDLFTLLRTEMSIPDSRSVYRAFATAVRIFTEALSPSKEEPPQRLDYAAVALRMVDENFTSPETTVNFLAEQLQLNRCYLSRLFHGKTGVTLSEYILRKRLEYAKELLIHSDHTVFNIASLCGFSDSSYFMRFFYKQTGMTPSQFRRSFLQEHKKRKTEKNNNSGLPSIISNE